MSVPHVSLACNIRRVPLFLVHGCWHEFLQSGTSANYDAWFQTAIARRTFPDTADQSTASVTARIAVIRCRRKSAASSSIYSGFAVTILRIPSHTRHGTVLLPKVAQPRERLLGLIRPVRTKCPPYRPARIGFLPWNRTSEYRLVAQNVLSILTRHVSRATYFPRHWPITLPSGRADKPRHFSQLTKMEGTLQHWRMPCNRYQSPRIQQ
jgi:hypothetical protein